MQIVYSASRPQLNSPDPSPSESPSEPWFDHERLEVYQESLSFAAWLSVLIESSLKVGDLREQLDRASTSIVLNIAEGNGQRSPTDRTRFFHFAHDSALECAAGLDILVAKAKLPSEQIVHGKYSLQKIVRLLNGLTQRTPSPEYLTSAA